METRPPASAPHSDGGDYPLEPLNFGMVGSELYYYDEQTGWHPAV